MSNGKLMPKLNKTKNRVGIYQQFIKAQFSDFEQTNLCQHTTPIEKPPRKQETLAAFQSCFEGRICRSNGTIHPFP